jgi:HEAT repeat protein
VESVQLEHDVDCLAGEAGEPSPIPWPAGSRSVSRPGEPESIGPPRSDDWEVLSHSADPVESFDEIESAAIHEVARFQGEQEAEAHLGLIAGVVLVLEQALDSPTQETDRVALLPFLQRVLGEAVAEGNWGYANRTLRLLRACDATWSARDFVSGLEVDAEGAARRCAEAVNRQGLQDLSLLAEFAEALGVEAVDWLMRIVVASDRDQVRMTILKSIILLAAAEPQRLTPWLTDERWFVVRNALYVLGEIGGDHLLPLLRSASRHPEPRVRRELAQAVGRMSPGIANPMLLEMLDTQDHSVLQAVLAQLSRKADPEVASRLIGLLRAADFSSQPEPYRHSLYRALASQGDAVVPELEIELRPGSLFSRSLDPHWQAVARCLAHINTPAAVAILEKGAKSSKSGIAKACEQALRETRRTHG